MDIRPRTLGEILDDAWRFAFADAPLLLMFNSLFLVPVYIVLLLLLAQPVSGETTLYLLPALAALCLPLTGLASAACQVFFQHRLARSQHRPRRETPFLALRAGLEHAAARAVLLCFALPGPVVLLVSFLPDTSPVFRFVGFLFGTLMTALLSFPLWAACTSLHVLLASGAARSGTLLRELRRDVAAASGKAAVLVLSRPPLVFFVALQLHLLAKVLLWVADNLCGFDTTLLDVQWTLFGNAVYTTALLFLSWLLLTPFFEAGNFLLHTDVRTRQEGLDLQYRVQRAFGVKVSDLRPSASAVTPRTLTVAVLMLLLAGVVRAEPAQSETIHTIRGEIETISTEIQKTEPYPGGQRWRTRLRGLQSKLSRMDGGARRFRWFERAIDGFADRKKDDALRILDDLQRRLALLEDSLAVPNQPAPQSQERHSPEDVKSLVRGKDGRNVERDQPRRRVERERPEIRREEDGDKDRPEEAPHRGGGRGTPVSMPASRSGGLSSLGWSLLGGLGLAVVALAVFLYLTSPRSPRTPKAESVTGTETLTQENEVRQVLEQSPATLGRQADALAETGRFRDAVRVLYLAVLALLHRQQLIRFEATRTNGEYVRQVRLSEQAPPQLHEQFEQLTHQFETAWYGDRPCQSEDYRACRTLSDEITQNG